MNAQRTTGRRRGIVALIVLFIILGLPVLWLIRGSDGTHGSSKKTFQPTQNTPPPPAEATFDPSRYSLSDASSPWAVVNKQRPLNPLRYAPADLVILPGGQYLRREAAAAYTEMAADAAKEGLILSAASGYRSYDTQVSVYNREVQTNGQAVADTQSARPGFSEHQTGQSLDLAGGGCIIEDCFGTTAEGKWAAAHAYTYGFIMRYPPGKTAVTGYRAEPWHFRYVGKDLAAELRKENILTLEEYFKLPAAPDYK